MGSGIAEICARAGLDVRVAVGSDASAPAGRRRITKSLDRGVQKGQLAADNRDVALAAIELTTCLDDLADRQLVIEAVREDEAAKVDLLGARAQNVIGLHFFNPVSALPLVEVVSSVLTEDAVRDRAELFVSEVLGKEPIRSPDRAGFLVNALLIPYLLGPLRLADLIGLDVTAAIADALYEEYKEPLYAPPPLLQRMVEGGLLGLQAFVALTASPGARGYYDAHRAPGATHHQALRALANRFVGILHGCLRHHTPTTKPPPGLARAPTRRSPPDSQKRGISRTGGQVGIDSGCVNT